MNTTECFVCFSDQKSENFITNICKCSGSLKIHNSCYLQLREYDDTCKICKTKYPKLPPKFINGFATIKNLADDNSPYDIFYTIDTNYKKQGIETWYEDGVIAYEIPYVNNVKHGIEKHYKYGSVCSILPYENGKLHGTVLGYKVDRSRIDEHGNFVSILESSTDYEYGNIIKESKKFYDTHIKENTSINFNATLL